MFVNQVNDKKKKLFRRLRVSVTILSLLAVVFVFWWLKLTGITIAGEAFCGLEEHTHTQACISKVLACTAANETATDLSAHNHTDACYVERYICGLVEHTHDSSCYSDLSADVETSQEWDATLPSDLAEMSAVDRLVSVAESQLGYTESSLNYQLDANGEKVGYTRYGAWYGNPYGPWSTMFTSFCLRYAGFAEYPIASGADALRIQISQLNFYQEKNNHSPVSGELMFLDIDQNGTIDSTAIVTEVNATKITVVQGDVNNAVAQVIYSIDDACIIGYGKVTDMLAMGETIALNTDPVSVGATATYAANMLTNGNRFVFYVEKNSKLYAFDGLGNAVEVTVENGKVYTKSENPELLLWTIGKYNTNSYAIKNVGNGRYLHPFYNSDTDNGITTPGEWGTTVSGSNSGMTFSHSAYIGFDTATNNFKMTRTQSENITFQIATATACTVWFDGTCGGMMSMAGADNTKYTGYANSVMSLPTQWKSPTKYEYTLQGWYDIVNNKHYKLGELASITGNTVFYPDWKAASYDVGQINSDVIDTVSTDSFVTTHMFDYNVLFNVLSERADVTISDSSHSETWSLLTSGNNPYNGEPTLNYIFRDWDSVNDISYPKGHNNINNPTSSGSVYAGLYTDTIRSLLFDPSTQTIGKNYLGKADHLFSIENDPSDEHYGYHYYDSGLNAASYNQSDQRFYVYNYLERTSDSSNSSDAAKYSDFLPLNSPYVNTNDKPVATYTYDGDLKEYVGTTHYQYDAKYNSSGSSENRMGTNFFFGMSIDIDFFLPESPGSKDASGQYGNLDLLGKEMHFKFSGDDDVWVLLDDKLVLDIGGIHGVESGDINFSTGIVSVNGKQTSTITSVEEGKHKLTILYLERGSSQSNCSIYFNLAPRFGLNLQKEDTLTQHYLDGAEFSVFTDRDCTIPAELWVSKESYERDEPSIHQFTVVDGKAYIWGLASGQTYYIIESKPPNDERYSLSYGVIHLPLNKHGGISDDAVIVDKYDENGELVGISDGFNVHGFRIDEETMQAYLIVTNAQEWVKDTTKVQIFKQWQDNKDHSNDLVTAYLTITDLDGKTRRMREMTLGEKNNWSYTWDNLPKYWQDGKTPVVYGVEEAIYPGYQSAISSITSFEQEILTWSNATSFAVNNTYILKSGDQCLSATSETATTLMFVDEATAKSSPLAQWKITSGGNNVYSITNLNGQKLTFKSSNPRNFYVTTQKEQTQTFTINNLHIIGKNRNTSYYPSSLQSNGTFSAVTSTSSAIKWSPLKLTTTTQQVAIDGIGYKITNVPIEEFTSVSVEKVWAVGSYQGNDYLQYEITVDLMKNGVYSGLSMKLTAINSWKATFDQLPYKDLNGDVIQYSVVEKWSHENWIPEYGEMVVTNGDPPTYSTKITNRYRDKFSYELPETGGLVKEQVIGIGLLLCISALLGGFAIKRKRRR
ncbi:MAG: Cna B-type domain-containing protein [Clostridia bacterium]|nr:Cna B-type domain-containing protein [Clostridia bacterium]